MSDSLHDLQAKIVQFVVERDWQQFHSPKNLACALSVEAAELLENFQWMSETESRELTPEQREAVRGEIADVFIYVVQMAASLDMDLLSAADDKMAVNAAKYPVDKARGSSKKYDKL
jgi:NTP pyrophosphatase (non-canonical NTP hydrolase)